MATPDVASGSTVEVTFDDAAGPHVVRGACAGTYAGALIVDSDTGRLAIPVTQAKGIRAQEGTYALEGALIGLVIDAVVLGSIVSSHGTIDLVHVTPLR